MPLVFLGGSKQPFYGRCAGPMAIVPNLQERRKAKRERVRGSMWRIAGMMAKWWCGRGAHGRVREASRASRVRWARAKEEQVFLLGIVEHAGEQAGRARRRKAEHDIEMKR